MRDTYNNLKSIHGWGDLRDLLVADFLIKMGEKNR